MLLDTDDSIFPVISPVPTVAVDWITFSVTEGEAETVTLPLACRANQVSGGSDAA